MHPVSTCRIVSGVCLFIIWSCSPKTDEVLPVFSPGIAPAANSRQSAEREADQQRFREARPGYRFVFPRDHDPHPGFRTEWWYYTGFLRGEAHEEFAFQFTLFKIETVAGDVAFASPSRVYMGHFALTDRNGDRFYYREIYGRDMPGISGFSRERQEIYLQNASLRIDGNRHRFTFSVPPYTVEVDLHARLAPILQGVNGTSRKSFTDSYSHYYSVVDLTGSARMTEDLPADVENIRTRITGTPGASSSWKSHSFQATGWMDHEFMSNALQEGERGWDWLHFTMDNGVHYMLFRVRGAASDQDYFGGARISANGEFKNLSGVKSIRSPRAQWFSRKSGATYPAGFMLSVDGMSLEAIPWRNDQELITPVAGVAYWEGPVEIRGFGPGADGRKVSVTGRGFLEMTGYANSMKGKL